MVGVIALTLLGTSLLVLTIAFFWGDDGLEVFGVLPFVFAILCILGLFIDGGVIDTTYERYVYETPEFVDKETGERSIPDSAAIFYLIDSQWIKIESYKAEKK